MMTNYLSSCGFRLIRNLPNDPVKCNKGLLYGTFVALRFVWRGLSEGVNWDESSRLPGRCYQMVAKPVVHAGRLTIISDKDFSSYLAITTLSPLNIRPDGTNNYISSVTVQKYSINNMYE